nr:MAG TPA: hypothetical protein [Caudoviricetes sp.]
MFGTAPRYELTHILCRPKQLLALRLYDSIVL